MADVTRRRTGELLRKLFEILMAEPEGMRAKDALAALAASVTMSEYEAGDYLNGVRRFDNIVRFATVDAAKAGWFLKAKGTWAVTEEGRRAYAAMSDPEAFYREATRLFRQWRASQPDVAKPEGEELEGAGAEREVTQTFEQSEERAWDEIDRFLRQMPPYEFQDLVADLLRGMGYHVAWIAPPGRDGGMDILAFSDPLGARPPRIKVQVKRHQTSVSVEGVRSFLAVLGDEDVGIFVNVGGFTRDALEEARTQEKRRVTLIDLERLFDLWVEHYDRLSDGARRRMPLRPIWFLAPVE
ncbi:MAG: restriction endonuclease [Candidatus Eisenbacteria bacterium]|nr:restriction endonuclease [Candidatus Eisenbacteria bacterium]